MKTAIIVHGSTDKEECIDLQYPSLSNSHWFPWLQKQLTAKNILTQTPEMPVPYNPEYNKWKEVLEYFPLNEDTILIGHSCGGGFIVRYLSENNIKIGKVILVAPWIDPDKELQTGMFDFNIDENIVSKTKGITIFSSTNDMQTVQDSIKILKEKIKDLKIVEFKNKGHFISKHMGTDKFPELLTEAIS